MNAARPAEASSAPQDADDAPADYDQWPAPRRRRRRWTSVVGMLFFLAVVGWLGSSALVSWRLTSRPRAPYPEPLLPLAGGRLEELRLSTADGLELGAWYLGGDPDRAALLLLHAHEGARTGQRDLIQALAPDGRALLAVTQRCHGDSGGERLDFGATGRRDVLAAVEYLELRRPGGRIVVVGTSLGAAAAILALPELSGRVDGWFLEAPFSDLGTATRNRLAVRLPRPLDELAYAGMRLWAPLLLGVDPDAISPLAVLTDTPPVAAPAVFLIGSDDRLTLPSEVRALAQAWGDGARYEEFPGAAHGWLRQDDPERYMALLGALLDEVDVRR